jgi:hypothetical protein
VPSIEGKATRVGASEAGRRASFNTRRDQRHAVDPKLDPHRRFRVRLSLARERIEVRVAQNGRTIWIVDAYRDGTRFLVRADEILIAF